VIIVREKNGIGVFGRLLPYNQPKSWINTVMKYAEAVAARKNRGIERRHESGAVLLGRVTHSKKELRPLRARSCNPACGLRAEMLMY
jgi:hypothetical protein